jgi:hypothetical protein
MKDHIVFRRRFARFVAAPAICAGVLGSAALGLAGFAHASSTYINPSDPHSTIKPPDVVATPQIIGPALYPYGHYRSTMGADGGDGGGGGD